MGFSFKILPGVTVHVSSHGIRWSLGSRKARLHVGGRRTAVSTRVGPVRYKKTVGRNRRTRRRRR